MKNVVLQKLLYSLNKVAKSGNSRILDEDGVVEVLWVVGGSAFEEGIIVIEHHRQEMFEKGLHMLYDAVVLSKRVVDRSTVQDMHDSFAWRQIFINILRHVDDTKSIEMRLRALWLKLKELS